MKRFVRWLLGPVVRWAIGDLTRFMVVEKDGAIVEVFLCVEWGWEWSVSRTPDEIRDRAWEMIGMADAVPYD